MNSIKYALHKCNSIERARFADNASFHGIEVDVRRCQERGYLVAAFLSDNANDAPTLFNVIDAFATLNHEVQSVQRAVILDIKEDSVADQLYAIVSMKEFQHVDFYIMNYDIREFFQYLEVAEALSNVIVCIRHSELEHAAQLSMAIPLRFRKLRTTALIQSFDKDPASIRDVDMINMNSPRSSLVLLVGPDVQGASSYKHPLPTNFKSGNLLCITDDPEAINLFGAVQ